MKSHAREVRLTKTDTHALVHGYAFYCCKTPTAQCFVASTRHMLHRAESRIEKDS